MFSFKPDSNALMENAINLIQCIPVTDFDEESAHDRSVQILLDFLWENEGKALVREFKDFNQQLGRQYS